MSICRKCWEAKRGMLSGQGFTSYECAICGKMFEHCNTNVPKICPECAEKLNVCQRCLDPLGDKKYD